MIKALLPHNEKERMEALHQYAVLDTAPEEAFDDLTTLAAAICETPIALVSLVDAHRQWFKSKVGVADSETSRDIAFCAHGILQKDMFVVPDATQDERFSDNPLVTSDPHVRFYAGVPLITAEGLALGMLCVNDRVPRTLTPEQTRALKILGRQVVNQLELRRQVAELARTMLTRSELEKKIRISEKMSAVGQLASGVAHEINNPLGVILGFAQAVVRRLPPNDPLELPMKSIEKEANRCKNLVQDLLTFSRASKVEREPMDINRAVEGSFSLITAQARIGRVSVLKNLAVNLPRILGNPNQIQQVIINLANNALDAMGETTGTLTIKTESLNEDPLSWVCLKVTDTGPGIPPEILSRIFDPFFTTKSVGKGTGLGLSLVHEIIEKHSGVVDIQSQPGHTEFCIKFPASTFKNSMPSAKSVTP